MKATLTSENPPEIKVINRTDADKIIINIKNELGDWKVKNFLFHLLVGILGTIAILGSVIVSVYLDTRSEFLTAERLKIIAIASTVSLSILSAFNIITKTNNYISACDLMQVALFKYNAKLINLGTLIEAYDKANKIIGGIDFNFDKNFNGAGGKTVVSVDTDEDLHIRDEEGKIENEGKVNPERATEELTARPGTPTKNSITNSRTERSDKKDTTKPTAQPTSDNELAPVKSEAIINTDDVSVLVSEKK